MSIQEILRKKTLFWEYDPDAIDVVKHRSLVIGRILEYGDLEDIHWMLEQYDRKDIVEEVLADKGLGKKSVNFWRGYLGIDEKLCTKKPLTQTQSAFSKR